MKKILLLFIFVICTGCLTQKRLVRYIEPFVVTTDVPVNDTYIFDNILLEPLQQPLVVKYSYDNKNREPIDVFAINIKWNVRLAASISPEVIAKEFETIFIALSKESGLHDKLNGRKLYIRIEQVPNEFLFIDKNKYDIGRSSKLETKEEKQMREAYDRKYPPQQKMISPINKPWIIKYAFIEEKKTTAERSFIIEANNKTISKRKNWEATINYFFKEYQTNLALTASQLVKEIGLSTNNN